MLDEIRIKFGFDLTDDEWAALLDEVRMRVAALREGDPLERVYAFFLEELVESDDDMGESYD